MLFSLDLSHDVTVMWLSRWFTRFFGTVFLLAWGRLCSRYERAERPPRPSWQFRGHASSFQWLLWSNAFIYCSLCWWRTSSQSMRWISFLQGCNRLHCSRIWWCHNQLKARCQFNSMGDWHYLMKISNKSFLKCWSCSLLRSRDSDLSLKNVFYSYYSYSMNLHQLMV